MAIKTPLSRPNKVFQLPNLSRLNFRWPGRRGVFSWHWRSKGKGAKWSLYFCRKCFGDLFWKRFGLSLNSLHTLLKTSEGKYTTEMQPLEGCKTLTYSITFCKSVKYWKTSLGRRQTKTITELLDFRSKSRKSRLQNLQRGPPKSRLLSVPKHA